MKGFHFFCQWPAVIWIKHWFYRKFSHCIRDDSLPPQKPFVSGSSRRSAKPRREGWRRWEMERRELEQRRRSEGGGGSKRTTLKWEQGDGWGLRGAEQGDTGEHRGDEKKEQGTRRAAIKRGRRERKKDSHRIERGKSFLKYNVQISLLFPSLSNTCHNSSP